MQSAKIGSKNRQVCIGDLNTRITIHVRSVQTPVFEGIDFTEKFNPSEEVWAMVTTVAGKTLFDGINQDVALSHEIYIRYRDDVNSESWIDLDGILLDILRTEDLDESHEFLRLFCTLRGSKELGGAQA